jgi:hypothetical protein
VAVGHLFIYGKVELLNPSGKGDGDNVISIHPPVLVQGKEDVH